MLTAQINAMYFINNATTTLIVGIKKNISSPEQVKIHTAIKMREQFL
jgi:hypothetical protein